MRLDHLQQVSQQAQPGTVVALSGETGRYTQFAICMQSLGFRIPPGSSLKWMMGNDIAESRNRACAEMEGDWIWFIDDDHAFQDDLLQRLLARNVDVVTPICLRRNQPFLPIPCAEDNFMDLARYGPEELVAVDHAGASGMLIRKRVLEAVPEPWFELGNGVSEDVNFCRKARAAGFDVYVDMAARLGHMTTAVVWPVWQEDEQRWYTGFTVADGAQLAIEPAPLPDEPIGE